MSFTTEIKKEISKNELKDHCLRAELSALIQLTSSIQISNGSLDLLIRTESPITAGRIKVLLKERYQDLDHELVVMQKTNLRKNNIYLLTVRKRANEILSDLGLYNTKGLLLEHPLYHIIQKDCCARAYLAGAFLAFGSCNDPSKSDYHLEISFMSINHAQFTIKLLSRFMIEAKFTKRRNKFVVYVKKADDISDFLRCVGASESLMKFEDARIQRDFTNSIVRLNNCEIANEMKSLKASAEQINDMEKIIKSPRYEVLDEKLKKVIELRLTDRDLSLSELCVRYEERYGEKISKSGLKHRLVKIHEIAKGM